MADANSGKEMGCWGSGILLLVVGAACIAFYNHTFGEQEGNANYQDCRVKVDVQEGSTETFFKQFTCSYIKTQSGKVLSGQCVHIVAEGAVCQTAYIYTKKAEVHCNDPKFPYPAYDDRCYAAPQ